jgi:hypothetical protein
MRFAKPLGPDQLSSFDSSVFGKQRRLTGAITHTGRHAVPGPERGLGGCLPGAMVIRWPKHIKLEFRAQIRLYL